MAKRYFNWKLAFVLAVAVVVFAAAAFALHSWQRSTRAEQALPLGEQAYDQGDWEEAARQFGRYLVVHGSDIPILLKYADAQLKIRPLDSANIQQAIAAYSSILRLDGANTEAARQLVEIYLGMGSPGEAELKARQYLKQKDDTTIRRFLGVALIQQRKFREAGIVLADLIRESPDQILAYEAMGRLALTRPDDVNEPAAHWFDEAVRQNPNAALAYVVRSAHRRQTGDRSGAAADLEHAETLDLSDTDVHLRLIGELIRAAGFDKAREHLRIIQATDPAERMLWQYWADVATQSGSLEEMKTVADEGMKELAAQPWDFMPIAAELLIRTGQFEKAGACILQMKEKNVQPARVAFLEGLLAEQRGQLREAIASWETAIGLGYQSPQDERWRRRLPLVRVVLASAFLRTGDTQSAIGQLRTLVSEMPTYAGGHLFLARLEAQTGNWAAVVDLTRQVKQLVPDNAEAEMLELQARIRQLTLSDETAAAPGIGWSDVDNRLARLGASGVDEPTGVQVRLLQAESAILQKKYEQAAAILDALRQDHPEERRAVLLRAQLYVGQEDIPKATTLLRQAVEQFPQSVELATRLALLYNGQEKRSECESVVKDALARIESPRMRHMLSLFLADFYAAWGQTDQLYDWLTEVTGQFPEDIQAKRRLLVLDRVLNDPERAQKIVDEIKTIEREKGWQWKIEQARVWIRSDKFESRYTAAVRLLQENLLANPEDQASRMLLGAAYEKAGEARLAVSTYREALDRSRPPDDLQIMLILGAAHEQAGDLSEALAVYRRALKRAPTDMRAIGRTVEALYKAEQFEEAQRILEQAAQRDLRHADLQKLQLEGDLQRGALSSASAILQEMVQRDPNDTSAKFTLALLRARQGKFDEAQAILADLRSENPDSIRVAEAQTRFYIAQGRGDQAVELCDELVARLNSVAAYTLRARTHAELQHYDEALADLDRAVALAPDEPSVWLARASFHRDRGRSADEVEDIKRALSLAPGDLAIQQHALRVFLASGDRVLFNQAETLLEQALKSHPENSDLKILKARLLMAKKTVVAAEQAQVLLGEIVADNPELIEAWELLGRLELGQKQFGDAMDVALRGLAHNPDNRQLLLLKADAEALRSPMLAVPTLKELLRQDPNDLEAIARLADVDSKSDRPDKTQELLQLLRERLMVLEGPARRRCETILAVTLYRNGQDENAMARFEALVKEDPNDPAPLLALAQLPEALRRCPQLRQLVDDWMARHPDDIGTPTVLAAAWIAARDVEGIRAAEGLLRSVLERAPESVAALLVLGDLTGATGRLEEHANVNRRILEIAPNNVIAMNNLAWYLCEEQGQYQEALTLATRGLELAPEYLDLIDTRGVAHYRMGHMDEAVRDFTRFIELCPPGKASLATTRFHLARTYSGMGNSAEAVRQLEQISGLREGSSRLSPSDQAEARRLLEQLRKGS
ncbi:MAG: tetratricopeptide repeat protein [Phycisphaerales bacterium]|nr:MAG: tetratricopeptide repeat protein [Phycisphaerales bacterium]